MTTRSDTSLIENDEEKVKEVANVKTTSGSFEEHDKTIPNKSVPFISSSNSNASTVDWNNFHRNFDNFPPFSSNQRGGSQKSKSTFNFNKCTVQNAIIGAKKPVTINSTHETYKKGAQKKDIKITGGNFPQANIAGKAEYNNEKSNISAVSGPSNQPCGELIEIDTCSPPFSPEQYLIKLLKTGISSKHLMSLLEKKYSVVELAYSIPNSTSKQDRMVETLLEIAD